MLKARRKVRRKVRRKTGEEKIVGNTVRIDALRELLKNDDKIYITDPKHEYENIGKALGVRIVNVDDQNV